MVQWRVESRILWPKKQQAVYQKEECGINNPESRYFVTYTVNLSTILMKNRTLALIFAFFSTTPFVFAQDYAFKVLANKGSNEVKSGETWQPLKTGSSLKKGDEVKLATNAYIGLVHATGKPME